MALDVHSHSIGGTMTTIVYRLIADDEEQHYQQSFFVKSINQAVKLFHMEHREFTHEIVSIFKA